MRKKLRKKKKIEKEKEVVEKLKMLPINRVTANEIHLCVLNLLKEVVEN